MILLRRFAIGLIKTRGLAVAETLRNLVGNPSPVLDFLKMTDNAAPSRRHCRDYSARLTSATS